MDAYTHHYLIRPASACLALQCVCVCLHVAPCIATCHLSCRVLLCRMFLCCGCSSPACLPVCLCACVCVWGISSVCAVRMDVRVMFVCLSVCLCVCPYMSHPPPAQPSPASNIAHDIHIASLPVSQPASLEKTDTVCV